MKTKEELALEILDDTVKFLQNTGVETIAIGKSVNILRDCVNREVKMKRMIREFVEENDI